MIPGITVAMGGKDWIIPPLTLGAMRRLGPSLDAIDSERLVHDPAAIGAIIAVVTIAMQRNYPELTEDAVAELLDMGNAPTVFVAVLTGSGLRRADPGEAAAPANGATDGASFTGSLQPPSDGESATSMS